MSKKLNNKDDTFGKSSSKQSSIKGDRSEIKVVNNNKGKTKEIIVIGVGGIFLLLILFFGLPLIFTGDKKEDTVIIVNTSDQEQWNHDSKVDVAFDKAKRQFSSLSEAMSVNNQSEEVEEVEEVKEEVVKEGGKPKEVAPPEKDGRSEDDFIFDDSSFTTTHSSEDLKRKLGGEILLNDNAIQFSASANSKDGNRDHIQTESGWLKQNSSGNSSMIKTESFADGYVEKLKINRDFLLGSGTSLSCVLKTKVVTNYGGLVLCQLSRDIYSANGKNLLVRKGAMLEGTQTEAVVQGASRVFITWGQIIDQDHVVRIDALGTDTLGASGVPAWIDTHFWKRFGNSLLLSFIDDALATATSHLQRKVDADNVTIDSMSSQGTNLAEIALENSINIEPTAYINQGTVINVLVPRNIDFSTVYKNINYK